MFPQPEIQAPARHVTRHLSRGLFSMYLRRPRPSPRQGRRLGPPQVWNLFLLVSNASMLRGFPPRPSLVQACRLPAFQPLKSPAGASTRHSGHRHLLLEPLSLPFASLVHGSLLLGRSTSLPFAHPLKPLKYPAPASTRHSGHRHLVLEP